MTNKNKEAKNERRWTKTELNTYADVLADPESCFAATLDKLALKKSSNNEVFECIQIELVSEMEAEDFQTRNSEHFKGRPTKLNTSIEKLRTKYKWFKQEWSNKTTRAKNVERSKETELNDIDREIMETTDDGEEKQDDDDPPGEVHQEKPPRNKSKVVVPAHKKSEKI